MDDFAELADVETGVGRKCANLRA
jgi:hypothetical protein